VIGKEGRAADSACTVCLQEAPTEVGCRECRAVLCFVVSGVYVSMQCRTQQTAAVHISLAFAAAASGVLSVARAAA